MPLFIFIYNERRYLSFYLQITTFLTKLSRFHLPISGRSGHIGISALSLKMDEISWSQENDIWSYFWGSDKFQSKQFVFPVITSIWKSKCTMKIKVFLWLLLVDRLNTKAMLQRRNFMIPDEHGCVICLNNQLEGTNDLFFTCQFA